MAYRYVRRTSRRNAKRSTLSNYKIATRTSARSQAKQIYALKKRINRIQRMTRPETRIVQHYAAPIDVTSQGGKQTSIKWVILNSSGESDTTPQITPSLGPVVNNTETGSTVAEPNNFARLNSFTLYGNIQYETPTSNVKPVAIRILICQLKASRPLPIYADDVFSGITGASNDFISVYGPLQTGLARNVKVLSNKRYVLSFQRPNIAIKTRLKYLLSFYRDVNNASGGAGSSDTIAKGSIMVFYSVFGPVTEQGNEITLNFNYKLAYTDS